MTARGVEVGTLIYDPPDADELSHMPFITFLYIGQLKKDLEAYLTATFLLATQPRIGQITRHDPTPRRRRKVSPSAPGDITTGVNLVALRENAKRILAASVEMGKPTSGLIHLLLLNGLRLGETLAARIEDLSTIDHMTALTLPNRKMGVMDTVTLPAATVEVLGECIGKRQRGRILLDRGRVLTPSRVYTLCNQMSAICGLDTPVRPHQLRATFVTLSLDAGVPYRDVMASTGHADMSMVAYYDRAHAAIRRNASHRLSDWLKD